MELVGRKAFHVLQACTNAILSTLESLGKDPSEPIDVDTRELLKVTNGYPVGRPQLYTQYIDWANSSTSSHFTISLLSYSHTNSNRSTSKERFTDAPFNGKRRSFLEMAQQSRRITWLRLKGSNLWNVMTPQLSLFHLTSTENRLARDSIFPSRHGQSCIKVYSHSRPTTNIVSVRSLCSASVCRSVVLLSFWDNCSYQLVPTTSFPLIIPPTIFRHLTLQGFQMNGPIGESNGDKDDDDDDNDNEDKENLPVQQENPWKLSREEVMLYDDIFPEASSTNSKADKNKVIDISETWLRCVWGMIVSVTMW